MHLKVYKDPTGNLCDYASSSAFLLAPTCKNAVLTFGMHFPYLDTLPPPPALKP